MASVRRLTCQEVLDQLSDYLDDQAHAELVGEVDHHLGACVHCRVEVDTLRRTIMFYRHEERIELPDHLTARLGQVMESAYREGCRGKESGEA